MNDIRPVDLPELRSDLLAWHSSEAGVDWWSRREFLPASERVDTDGTIRVCALPPEERRAAEVSRLEHAGLFYVSREMTQLAVAAGETLPDFTVQEFDLPSAEGFIVFAEPVGEGRTQRGEWDVITVISAMSWSIATNAELGTSLWVSFYSDRDRSSFSQGGVARRSLNASKFGYVFDLEWSFGGSSDSMDGDAFDLGRILIAAWLLMRQPLASTKDVEPDRAAKKRLRRAGQEPKSVRVIELRRPKSSGEHGDGESNYHHQWIVKGHWRQHWYPKREVHRPVWIAPHVKGPEGAPLIGGEKVYALKR